MQLHFRQDREEISPPARFHSNFIQLRDLRECFSFSVLQAKLASYNCTSLDQNDLRSDFFPLDLPRGGLRANRGPEISHGTGEAVRVQADGSFSQIYSTHLSTRNGHGVIENWQNF